MDKKIVNIHDMDIYASDIVKAEQCLIDNGIDSGEVQSVLQALGYILLDVDFYEDWTV